jgi:hypothetical protein
LSSWIDRQQAAEEGARSAQDGQFISGSRVLYAHDEMYTDPASEPNQLELRLCTFGPTERYSCTQISREARFWADLGDIQESSPYKKGILGALPRYLCTEPLRYRYRAIHLTVGVQYVKRRTLARWLDRSHRGRLACGARGSRCLRLIRRPHRPHAIQPRPAPGLAFCDLAPEAKEHRHYDRKIRLARVRVRRTICFQKNEIERQKAL